MAELLGLENKCFKLNLINYEVKNEGWIFCDLVFSDALRTFVVQGAYLTDNEVEFILNNIHKLTLGKTKKMNGQFIEPNFEFNILLQTQHKYAVEVSISKQTFNINSDNSIRETMICDSNTLVNFRRLLLTELHKLKRKS